MFSLTIARQSVAKGDSGALQLDRLVVVRVGERVVQVGQAAEGLWLITKLRPVKRPNLVFCLIATFAMSFVHEHDVRASSDNFKRQEEPSHSQAALHDDLE